SNRSLHHSSNSIQTGSGCRGANRTLIASFKDSRPASERPGIAPPIKHSADLQSHFGSSGENRTPISTLKYARATSFSLPKGTEDFQLASSRAEKIDHICALRAPERLLLP